MPFWNHLELDKHEWKVAWHLPCRVQSRELTSTEKNSSPSIVYAMYDAMTHCGKEQDDL